MCVPFHPERRPTSPRRCSILPRNGALFSIVVSQKITTQQAYYLTFYALKQVHQCNIFKNLLQTVKFTFKIRKMLNRTYFVPLLPGLPLAELICTSGFMSSWCSRAYHGINGRNSYRPVRAGGCI